MQHSDYYCQPTFNYKFLKTSHMSCPIYKRVVIMLSQYLNDEHDIKAMSKLDWNNNCNWKEIKNEITADRL